MLLKCVFQLFGIAAAQNDVIDHERGFQPICDIVHGPMPFLFSQAQEAALANVIFEGPSLTIRQVSQFHRGDHFIDDHRRSQARTEPEKEHAAAFVAAERLHGGVVDDANRLTEASREIEPDPAAAQVSRFEQRLVMHDRSGISDRHAIERPIGGFLQNFVGHFGGGQRGPGREFTRSPRSFDEEFEIRTSDIDRQHAHGQFHLGEADIPT